MKRKHSQILVLVLLLVVFPAVSWLYLRKGLDYRLEHLERLQPKVTVPAGELFEVGAIQVIYSSSANESRLDPIREHYEDLDSVLRFVSYDYDIQPASLDSLDKAWKLAELSSDFADAVFLTDTSNQILHCYRLLSEEDLVSLGEDIAFLLPPEPEKDFDFRREREK